MTALLAIAAILALFILALRLAFPLPRPLRDKSSTPPPDAPSELCDEVEALASEHPGDTGLLLLSDPVEALASRIAHVRAATRSIDAQYFIWKGDLSGRMLLAELVRAAERGVRVRVLVDDVTTARLDPIWAAAAALPGFEVRLFNPLTIRRPRALSYLINPLRLNRRMHNKSMTFDGAVSIVGGRNIGDEYFGAREKGLFIDLDALVVGGIVGEIAQDFERYWCSVSSFPAQQMLPAPDEDDIAALGSPVHANPALAAEYAEALHDSGLLERLAWQAATFFWRKCAQLRATARCSTARSGTPCRRAYPSPDPRGAAAQPIRPHQRALRPGC
ncbi:MAG: phospholipase D-like domain-containing protein [Sphingomonadaceae bacterium]